MSQPQTIGVIGAGTMGSNIAQVCAVAGLVVEQRVAKGKVGRKSGRGFHTYA